MTIYSHSLFSFIEKLTHLIQTILSKEAHLKVRQERFYNQAETHSYPIKVSIYDNKQMVGYFDPEFYELGFHKKLMQVPEKQLKDIVRHEVAHYLTFIEYGRDVLPHAQEFKNLCRKLGWGEEVSKASFCLEIEEVIEDETNLSIKRKIEKLMALSTSSNPHEAEMALIKSRKLLFKHQIELQQLGQKEETFLLKRIFKQKKESAKMRAIAQILETFFVHVVYSKGREHLYLEVLGSKVNVEIAEYVAEVLAVQFEQLWERAQKELFLCGLIAKNSFFLGIAKGYRAKVGSLKVEHTKEESFGLIAIEKELESIQERLYPKLRLKKSKASYCPQSAALGERVGKKLQISPAIGEAPQKSALLIS